jgi:LTXXQ motif family protein
MRDYWIGLLATATLVISAFGQNSIVLQPPAINSVVGTVAPDKSSGAEVQISGDTLVVSPPDSSADVPTAIVEYLDLSPVQVVAIQAQIEHQRVQTQSLIEQLTNNRRELIATTLQGRFDIGQVRKLATQQARILEPLVVANARLQTEIYKILTVEQQRKLDEMRKETAALTHPSLTEW